jgi:hypothetical protein
MSPHVSRFALDLVLAGAAGEAERAHVEGCARCSGLVEELRRDDGGFLGRFPSFETLPAGRARAAVPEPRSWIAGWKLGLAGALAAAAVVVALRVVPRDHVPPGTRLKGGSIVELAVSRGGRSFAHDEGVPLRPGDVLAFRYSTQQPYLLLLSVERSGKVSIYFTDTSRQQSLHIQPGRDVQLKLGVELDEYVGPERVIALLSARPLAVEAVREAVALRFRSLAGSDRDRLELGSLPFEAEQFSWLLDKGRRER